MRLVPSERSAMSPQAELGLTPAEAVRFRSVLGQGGEPNRVQTRIVSYMRLP
jgi:hypothetical protein